MGEHQPGPFPAYTLTPDSFPIVCEFYAEANGQLLYRFEVPGPPAVLHVPPMRERCVTLTRYGSGYEVAVTSTGILAERWRAPAGAEQQP